MIPSFWELRVRKVSIGIESGSQSILDQMGKNTNKETITRSVELLHDNGFLVNGLFILGHRGESPHTVRETLDFARSLPLDFAWFSYMVPFPGTPVWDEGVERHGRILNENMADWGNVNPIFLPHGLELEQLTAAMEEGLSIRKDFKRRTANLELAS